MAHDVLGVLGAAAEPLVRVLGQQAAEQVLGLLRQIARELDLLHEDQLEEDVMVAVVERQPAAHHLVHDDAQAPPVDGAAVVVVLEHLGRQVLGRAAERLRRPAVRDVLLAQAKVGDLDVAVLVQQQVLQLQEKQ